MTKGRIISALILIGALAIAGSSYIFYFAAKLQEYADADTLKKALEQKAEDLEDVFSAASPDLVIQEWTNVRPTFDSTRNRRGAFFNFADWEEHPMHTPADGIVKYWYEDQAQAMLDDLRAAVIEKQIRVFPRDLRAMLMIPSSAQYEGRNVDVEVAYAELSRLNFGINTAKMLLENNVKAVNRIWLWKPREATETGGLLTYQTLGCHVFITLPDLVNFFESLRADDRYFSIEAVRLIYNQPGVDREPVLDAQFLITQAKYIEIDAAMALVAMAAEDDSGYGDDYGYSGYRGAATAVPEEPGFLGTAWSRFKRWYFLSN